MLSLVPFRAIAKTKAFHKYFSRLLFRSYA